jgi:hypothetical protein
MLAQFAIANHPEYSTEMSINASTIHSVIFP